MTGSRSVQNYHVEEVPAPWSLTARWIFPISQPPIPHGTLVIHGDRIFAVEDHRRSQIDLDLGDVVVLPGFVNAHTHLDLTGLHKKCPPSPDFTGWLRQVIAHRISQTREEVEADIREGVRQCLAAGTTTVGDITAKGWSLKTLSENPIRATVFYELLGLTEERAEQAWATALEWLRTHHNTETSRLGLSPHAPYSVRNTLFRQIAEYCRAASPLSPIAVATHFIESVGEVELLDHQTGPFREFLQDLGVWDPNGLVESPQELIQTLAGCLTLFVHTNYLSSDIPISKDATIVYCPRTHAAFGHRGHSFREFLNRGVRVALGTDGLSSNPDLSILEEIRWLRREQPDVAGDQLFRMATLSGAEALGWGSECGSLCPGKSADLVIVPIRSAKTSDPHEAILQGTEPPWKTLFCGQWTHHG
ncbi:MAG: amidohydrolase family protein [Gemmataceae bacterium]